MDISTLIPDYPPIPSDQISRNKLANALYDRADSPDLSSSVKTSIRVFAANIMNPPIISDDILSSLRADAQKVTSEIKAAFIDAGL